MIRKYKCIKPFPNTTMQVGDVLEIEKRSEFEYVIDGAIGTTRELVYKHFELYRLEGYKFSPYSHSKMETWVSCPQKFNYQYIIKPPRTFVPSPILEKGTLFHAILEFDIEDDLDNFDIPDKFKALTKKDKKEIVTQALTFTVKSKKYKKIKNLSGIKVPEQEMFLGSDLKPVETLQESLIRGFIDLIIWDEKTKTCHIYDWKTGGKSKEALKKWPKSRDQLELYAIWAHETYGAEVINTAFVYAEHDYLAEYRFTKDDINALKSKFQLKIEGIENDGVYGKNLTQLCAWCDFKELCLGIPADKEPRSITKDDIFEAARNMKGNKKKPKKSKFLEMVKEKNKD